MEQRGARVVLAIGVFKLVKAALLIFVGVALLLELPEQIGAQTERALHWLGVGAGRHTIGKLSERLWHLDASTEKHLAVLSLAYAGVFATEGVGLLLRRRWAEWLTVFVTGSFIPLELYELERHYGPGKLIAVLLNLAIVVYLTWLRLQDRPARNVAFKPPSPSPT